MRMGFFELLIILAILSLIVGPTQIPKLSKSLGEAVKGYKDGLKNVTDEETTDLKEEAVSKIG